MRILHTADWHLGDRLGRIDRTGDLRRAVERIGLYCQQENVDVLLVAGDLFSELAGAEGLREAIRHLQLVFADFLGRGGTILSLTGNHDKETFCQTLQYAMSLAAPVEPRPGKVLSPGRFYLATEPTLLRLHDRTSGIPVQFVLMPYPTPTRYLTDATSQRYKSLEEKNRLLMDSFSLALKKLCQGEDFDRELPSILAAHIHVHGGQLANLFRMSLEEDVVLNPADLPVDFDYVALGHIHRAQALLGHSQIRYSGSIDRMDLGEASDNKGVVFLEILSKGQTIQPTILPLEATPIYSIDIRRPSEEIPLLEKQYPNCQRALVQIRCTYRAGVENREEILRDLERIFPRWYDREVIEASNSSETLNSGFPAAGKSFRDTVRDYLQQELINHDEAIGQAILNRVDELLGRLGDDSSRY